eukprot:Blabericola_migrator_1__4983@NODE_2590_length_2566_cov_83_555822_g1622_i0_p2_GENE_NODE_2590_length_2566_cov_83_555822_g1622_i0NODE_2590_length_2566_cov_83_555822_g1622_i0_p2_ORF_typecomplete_len179_score9_07Bap31/PF05529_12/3_4e07GDE_N_bis/PF14742_6/0_1Na_Ala_symp/PF01235_17/0_18_NODE_2590_length_2566_cov_83_555822_g1622_i07791315
MILEIITVPVLALCGLVTLLSGQRHLQRLSMQLSRTNVTLIKTSMTLGQLFLSYSVLRFAFQTFLSQHYKVRLERHLENAASGLSLASTDMEDRLRSRVWRSDRDFWITFCSLFLWMVYMRAVQLVGSFEHKIADLKRTQSPNPAPKRPDSSPSTEASPAPTSEMPTATNENPIRQRR